MEEEEEGGGEGEEGGAETAGDAPPGGRGEKEAGGGEGQAERGEGGVGGLEGEGKRSGTTLPISSSLKTLLSSLSFLNFQNCVCNYVKKQGSSEVTRDRRDLLYQEVQQYKEQVAFLQNRLDSVTQVCGEYFKMFISCAGRGGSSQNQEHLSELISATYVLILALVFSLVLLN